MKTVVGLLEEGRPPVLTITIAVALPSKYWINGDPESPILNFIYLIERNVGEYGMKVHNTV